MAKAITRVGPNNCLRMSVARLEPCYSRGVTSPLDYLKPRMEHDMHVFEWALNEWSNGRSAIRKRWDNTAACFVNRSTKQLLNVCKSNPSATSQRQLDWSDMSARDWMSGDSNSIPHQMQDHAAA